MAKDGDLSTTLIQELNQETNKNEDLEAVTRDPDLPTPEESGPETATERATRIWKETSAPDDPPSLEARLTQEVEAYKASGGNVTVFPAQKADPKMFETARLPKPEKTGSSLVLGYAKEPIDKAEALGQRMNLSAQNMENTGGGGGKPAIERGDIFAALAMDGMKKAEADLFIYFYTHDEKSRSQAWSLLMCKVADMSLAGNWGTRKRGILTGMVNTALDQISNPVKYRTYSGREYTRAIGAANNNTWKQYQPRYTKLLEYIELVIEKGERALRRQL